MESWPRSIHSSFFGRFVLLSVGCVCLSIGASSCGSCYFPDQEQFAPLASLVGSGQAVVRIYAVAFPGTEGLITHPWFVVKSAEATEFERWEVWFESAEPFGFVRHNLFAPEQDVGHAGPLVIAELVGSQAEPVVEFIQTESPNYPCKDTYVLLPGPNCATYLQWVLDHTGWQVALPPTIIGTCAPLDCP